jgi:hypothetical protein
MEDGLIVKGKKDWYIIDKREYKRLTIRNAMKYHKGDIIAYSGTPATFVGASSATGCVNINKVKCFCLTYKFLKRKFKSKAEMYKFGLEHHEKWTPGLVLTHNNKAYVVGWVAY